MGKEEEVSRAERDLHTEKKYIKVSVAAPMTINRHMKWSLDVYSVVALHSSK